MTKLLGSLMLLLVVAAGVRVQDVPDCPPMQPDVRVQDPAVWADYFERYDECERAREAEQAADADGAAPTPPGPGDASGPLFIDVP